MIASVAAAFLAWGRRNAWTPSAMASTPVSAVDPDANARRIRNRVRVPWASIVELRGGRLRASVEAVGEAGRQRDVDHQHEPVRRNGEGDSSLLRAAEVREGDEPHQPHRDRHAAVREPRRGRGDGQRPGGDAHRHGQHVVGQDRRRRDQARRLAEVLPGDDVGAAALGVGAHGLPVRRDHDAQDQRDHERDRQHVAERERPGRGQDEHHLLGGVGDRGQRVRGEHRQRQRLRQEGVLKLVAGHRPAEEDPLQDLPGAGPVLALLHGRRHGWRSYPAPAGSSAHR